MAKDEVKTTIDPDGLRYRSKAPGSPFSANGSFGAATMSCFLCGKHRPRSQLMSKKLLGKSQSVCAPSCKEAEAAAKAGGLVRPATVAGVSTPAAADAGGGK
ncbi:MAG: hypothetical protein ACOVOG_12775 [Rubrivivax sp.]|jgi:hypothetical protein|nr:hypothetical protein [Rubrivivax sp.]